MQQDFFLPEISISGYPQAKLRKVLGEVIECLHVPTRNFTCIPHTKDWTELISGCYLTPNNAITLADDHIALNNIEALLTKYQLTFHRASRGNITFTSRGAVYVVCLECNDKETIEHFRTCFSVDEMLGIDQKEHTSE